MEHPGQRDIVRTASREGWGVAGWVTAIAAQIALIFWVVRSEITARVFVSSWTLCMPGVLLLLALLWANARLKGRAFSRAELLAAYVAVSGTITLVGYNYFQVMLVSLGSVTYFATPENRWALLHEHLPWWLAPRDREALRGLFGGESAVPWDVWLGPLAWWGLAILLLLMGTLALNLLLADTWIRRERLAFPIAAIPLEITHPGGGWFRQRGLWIGFALPCVLNTLLALHHYWPAIPAIELKHRDLAEHVTELPWSALRPLYVGFTPFVVGLAYLAPLDVSFSIVFFQWCAKFQRLAAIWFGWMDATDVGGRGEPHLDDQTVGAFLALGGVLLVRGLLRSAPPDRRRSRRHAIGWVAAGCLGGVVLFFCAAGFPVAIAVALVALYVLTVLVIARVRAEAGFAWAYGPDRFTASLSHLMVNYAGSRAYSPKTLALLGFFHWFWWDLRFALMPAQMEALKIADAANVRRRQMVALLVVATVVAIVVGLYAVLVDSYRYGWATANVYAGPANGGKIGYTLAMNWLNNPTPPRPDKTAWMVGGGIVALLLGALRQRFVWWPFHPVGYAMAATATSYAFWSHYALAWLVKVLVLRYGGMRLFRASLPWVFGLILGDIASQTLWSLAGSILDVPVYQFVS